METLARGTIAPSRFWLAVAICAWIAAILGYWGVLTTHSLTPGSELPPPMLHSIERSFRADPEKHLLVMAVHPKCPCTHASVEELARLIARYQHKLQCVILVYRPAGASDDWADTALVDLLRQQPGTQMIIDVDGQQALELGMSTSGAVACYSPDGWPRYWGGITPERGHAGDSLGSDAIAAILEGRNPDYQSQPVYGCHIQAEHDTGGI